MTYELAKQLKDAGFTFIQVSADPLARRSDNFYAFGDGKSYYEPTLSELIEACMGFYYPSSFELGGKNTWWAILRNENNTVALVPVQTGDTPEEAVAKLWLELNKGE